MPILELVQPKPDWTHALGVALTRPPGVPERRSGEDPWQAKPEGRPRRVSDDLAWFRDALDEPRDHGLRPIEEASAVSAWESDTEAAARLKRLRERGILDAAGFLLHDPESEEELADLLAG